MSTQSIAREGLLAAFRARQKPSPTASEIVKSAPTKQPSNSTKTKKALKSPKAKPPYVRAVKKKRATVRQTDLTKDAMVKMLMDPSVSYTTCSHVLGISVRQITAWVYQARANGNLIPTRDGQIAKLRSAGLPPALTLQKSNVVPLKPDKPLEHELDGGQTRQVLPEDLTALAKQAARAALERLTKPGAFDKETVKDTAIVLGMITDKYSLLTPMEGRLVVTGADPKHVVAALMGVLPTDDVDLTHDSDSVVPENLQTKATP